ncbi:RabGAP/TBC [Aureobasidium sp. EXF-10728]|nr:RabGAP/TBC [Aureobasidium sp. EXF-10728]
MDETAALHTSASSSDLKRDSAIAKPTTASTNPQASTLTLSPSASVPSIIVHDAIAAAPKSTRNPPSFLRRKSKPLDEDSDQDLPESPRSNPSRSRIRSFHPIDMDIPTTAFDDLTSPDSLKFSTRGSIMVNSKKLAKMMRQHDGDCTDGDVTDTDFHTAPNSPTFSPRIQAPPSPPLSPIPSSPPNPKRLTTGPRTPSVHMLNAVLDGRRVLSAEERTFSQKVRSMYKYGDERAADWTTPAGMDREDTPEPPTPSRSLTNPRRRPVTSRSARPQDFHDRFSFIQNEFECAGGVEDWEDLSGKDVDRYGFINPTKFVPTEGPQGTSVKPSLQRVTTSLQLLSSSPRRRRGLIRGPSTARSSRSLPAPTRTNTRTTVASSPSGHAASVYSFQTSHSQNRSHNPFRSRDRRILDDASDMLTLPACLDNLAEEDAHEGFLRRREVLREEKWRKMARLMPEGPKGGGMNFEFDVTDPKLVARTWKGVPDKWRATAWHAFLSASAKRRGGCQSDEELIEIFHELQEESSADDVQIDVDVPRTISMHIMFRRRYRGGQRLLFRVLHAISVHFPSTGYVQGMASLAATLLCYYDEEHTFIMLVRMWELRGLKVLYEHGFSGLMTTLKEFETDWLANDQDLKAKLDDFGIDAMTYGTKWYLTLFNLSMPFPAQLRVWDVFMLLGDANFPGNPPPTQESKSTFDGADLSVLHATSAALVDATKSLIVEGDFENAMKVLTSWVPVRDEDMLMRVAKAEWKIHMKNRRHVSA